ncbi:MAG: cytochrome c biogenesis protein CcsA, partial [Anaerolineaceae bacterium]
MLANFGYGLLVIAFFLSLYGAVAAVVGARRNQFAWVESARLSTLLTFLLIFISTGILLYFLVSGHYEVEFVYSVASQSMSPLLRLTALWGGQSGSLLFWAWLMSGFSAAAAMRKWDRDRELLPWVILVLLVTLAFFLGLIIFVDNPFNRFWQLPNGTSISSMFQPQGGTLIVPPDGNGLNPLLRHPGMIFHPPLLYLGFVAFTVPFAYAIAALVAGRTDDRWIRLTRRWTLVAWLFLS